MRKGKSVIGKPILSLADGARLHDVKDVILAPADSVIGLLADEGGLLSRSLVVPIDQVEAAPTTRFPSFAESVSGGRWTLGGHRGPNPVASSPVRRGPD